MISESQRDLSRFDKRFPLKTAKTTCLYRTSCGSHFECFSAKGIHFGRQQGEHCIMLRIHQLIPQLLHKTPIPKFKVGGTNTQQTTPNPHLDVNMNFLAKKLAPHDANQGIKFFAKWWKTYNLTQGGFEFQFKAHPVMWYWTAWYCLNMFKSIAGKSR